MEEYKRKPDVSKVVYTCVDVYIVTLTITRARGTTPYTKMILLR